MSTFKFAYGDYEPVSLDVGSKHQAEFQALSWAYPITFTYFPLKDLIYIFSHVMLEKKVVILSQNLALVSATM